MAPRTTFTRLFFIALVVRFAAALVTTQAGGGFPSAAFTDADHYLRMAGHIARGEGWCVEPWAQAERPPLYPLFLAAHLLLFGGAAAALATQAALGAAMCVCVARVGGRLWGPRAGALAGLGTAVYPALVLPATQFLSEALYLPLVAAQLLAAVEAGWAAFARERRRALGWAAACGALGGLAALTRAGHLLFPLALAAAFAFAWWRARQLARPDGPALLAAGAAVLLLTHVLVVAPWTVRNRLVLGGFAPVTTQLGTFLYESLFPGATGGPIDWREDPGLRAMDARLRGLGELERDRTLRAEAWKAAREDPGRVARLAVVKVLRTWSPVPNYAGFRSPAVTALSLATCGPVLALAAVGLLRLRRGSILATLLLAMPVYITLLHTVFTGSIRYRLPAEPCLILLAAYALTGMTSPRMTKDQ